MFAIRVLDGEAKTFYCCEAENLLAAARRQGVSIPAGCYSGGCGMCKIKVAEGRFRRGTSSKAVLPDQERQNNYSLACKTYPESELTIKLCPNE